MVLVEGYDKAWIDLLPGDLPKWTAPPSCIFMAFSSSRYRPCDSRLSELGVASRRSRSQWLPGVLEPHSILIMNFRIEQSTARNIAFRTISLGVPRSMNMLRWKLGWRISFIRSRHNQAMRPTPGIPLAGAGLSTYISYVIHWPYLVCRTMKPERSQFLLN